MERDFKMIVKGEGLTRLQAERRFVSLYKREYERLAGRRGHVDALRSMVKTHKTRYNEVVREIRESRDPGSPNLPTSGPGSTEAA